MATAPELSILFICMGNICRSPAAEGVFRKYLVNAGLADRVAVASAGTLDYHACELPDSRMRRAAAQRGYLLDSYARQVRPEDFDRFDLMLAADRRNINDLAPFAPSPKHLERVRLIMSFSQTPGSLGVDVPDPYYGPPSGFDLVLSMLEDASSGLLAWTRDELGRREK